MIVPIKSKITVSVSGGADSSILYYELCKLISDKNLGTVIKPITIDSTGKPYHHIYASRVVEYVQQEFPNINHEYHECHHVDDRADKRGSTGGSIYDKFLQSTLENYYKLGYLESYSGTTMNPRESDVDWGTDGQGNAIWNFRQPGRDIPKPSRYVMKCGLLVTVPYGKMHKKDIHDRYIANGVLDTIFPMTYSCEARREDTHNFSAHCGKCWWCKERQWGFDRLI